MGVALKRNSKGFSPIIIIIVVLGVVAIAGFVLLSSKNPAATNQLASSEKKEEQLKQTLDKVEGQNYVFSYPKNYVKRADELGEDEILLFASSSKPLIPKNSDFQTIHLSSSNVLNANSVIPDRPDYQYCKSIAEKTRLNAEEKITAEVVFGDLNIPDGNGGIGCKITTEIVIVKQIDKMLWNPKNKSVTYDAVAVYNIATSQDQADILNAAVDAFTLK